MSSHRSGFTPSRMAMAIALACLGSPVLASQPAPVQADETTPATEKKDEADKKNVKELPVIVVTATRIGTDIMKTPVTVTAVTQESLTRQGINDMRGLTGTMPNMQVSAGPDSGVNISIRGIGSTNFTEIGDPAVGLHVAGLYSPRPQGALALMFDLEQVEVLRGPQGTLFGRNSTGGSVNIIPARPEFGETYGSAELDLGNYNSRQINVIQNFGVSDRFALRATFSLGKRDGWIDQVQDFTDYDLPAQGFIPDGIPDVDQRRNVKVDRSDFYYNRDEWAARLTGRWKLADNVDWMLAVEKFQDNSAGYIGTKDCEQAAGTRFACGSNPWEVKINVPGKMDMSIDTFRSNLVWDLDDSNTVEYHASYAIQKRSQQADDDSGYHLLPSQVTVNKPVTADGDWGAWPIWDATSITLASKYKSLVQELQYKHHQDNFKLVTGLFSMHEWNSIDYAQEQMVTAPFGFPISQYYHQPNRQIDAKAVFAQADWTFAPTWTATIGARYSRDSKTDKGGQVYGGWDGSSPAYYNGLFDPGTPGDPGFRSHNGKDLTEKMGPFAGPGAYALWGPPAGNDHSESWSKLTWRLGLTKELTPKSIFFTSLSTGYKAGGFGDKDDACDGKTCVDGPAGPHYTFFPYKPETVTNFEIGYKGMLLENKLSLSATAFFSRYKDMQVTGSFYAAKIIPNAPCPDWDPTCDVVKKWQTVNVGVVDIPGLEVEMDYMPTPDLRLGGYFSYVHSKIKNYDQFSDEWSCGYRAEMGAPLCPEVYTGDIAEYRGRQIYDITGNSLPLSPKYTFGVNASHSFWFGEYELVPWVNLKWQDKMYFSLRNLDNPHISDAQAAFTKVDLSLKLVAPKFWQAELYVLNATNKMTKSYAGDAGGYIKAYWNEPRMYGVRFKINY